MRLQYRTTSAHALEMSGRCLALISAVVLVTSAKFIRLAAYLDLCGVLLSNILVVMFVVSLLYPFTLNVSSGNDVHTLMRHIENSHRLNVSAMFCRL